MFRGGAGASGREARGSSHRPRGRTGRRTGNTLLPCPAFIFLLLPSRLSSCFRRRCFLPHRHLLSFFSSSPAFFSTSTLLRCRFRAVRGRGQGSGGREIWYTSLAAAAAAAESLRSALAPGHAAAFLLCFLPFLLLACFLFIHFLVFLFCCFVCFYGLTTATYS